jgi:hypothetical protein
MRRHIGCLAGWRSIVRRGAWRVLIALLVTAGECDHGQKQENYLFHEMFMKLEKGQTPGNAASCFAQTGWEKHAPMRQGTSSGI